MTQMGRALLTVGTALVLFLGGFALVVYVTRSEDRVATDNLLAEDLSRAIGTAEEETDGRVRLDEVATFAWDEVLLVAPETPTPTVSRALGSEFKGDAPFGRVPLLIFLQNGRFVRFTDYRGEGTFRGFDTPIARLPRARAQLRVNRLEITP